jgi:hypothetical protein
MNITGSRSATGRRGQPGRRVWARTIGPVSLVLFFTTMAMTMVWQNVRFTRASLKFEEARRRHDTLLSDLNSEHLKVSREVTLRPRARQRLGLIESSTEDMRLVAFDPDVDRALSGESGLLDRLVPAASAQKTAPSLERDSKERKSVDQERP